jgi:hypothetical protein
MFSKRFRRRRAPKAQSVLGRLLSDARGGVSFIEYIVIAGVVALVAILAFRHLAAATHNTVRREGIAFREVGGAGIPPVTLAIANVPRMPSGPTAGLGPGTGLGPGGGGGGRVHLPIIQPHCFAAGTPIATEDGLRPIESIAVGERVWSRDEVTGADQLEPVLQRFITQNSTVIGVDIPIDAARHEVLRVTENHRFFVPDHGWVPAHELNGSYLVSLAARGPPMASALESWSERTTVYNLEVENLHTYFVGEARVLVHNANPPGGTCTTGTGTVWDSITPTQPDWEGTVVPRSFELATDNGSVWVHGNATEHMAEYATAMLGRGVSQDLVNMATQAQLTSLQAAVNEAISNGVPYTDQPITVGGWELKFSPARPPGKLPALIHAMPL